MNEIAIAIEARPAAAWLVVVCLPVALWVAAIHVRMWWTGPRIEKAPEKAWR